MEEPATALPLGWHALPMGWCDVARDAPDAEKPPLSPPVFFKHTQLAVKKSLINRKKRAPPGWLKIMNFGKFEGVRSKLTGKVVKTLVMSWKLYDLDCAATNDYTVQRVKKLGTPTVRTPGMPIGVLPSKTCVIFEDLNLKDLANAAIPSYDLEKDCYVVPSLRQIAAATAFGWGSVPCKGAYHFAHFCEYPDAIAVASRVGVPRGGDPADEASWELARIVRLVCSVPQHSTNPKDFVYEVAYEDDVVEMHHVRNILQYA